MIREVAAAEHGSMTEPGEWRRGGEDGSATATTIGERSIHAIRLKEAVNMLEMIWAVRKRMVRMAMRKEKTGVRKKEGGWRKKMGE